MNEEILAVNARKAFDTCCAALDDMDFRYDSRPEDLVIVTGAKGDDLPMNMIIRINPETQRVVVLSKLPGEIPSSMVAEMAVAVCEINYMLVDGCFDYDIKNSALIFRMNHSFMNSELGKEAFQYMVRVSFGTIDEFNEKLAALAEGVITLEQFIQIIHK